MFTRCHTTLLRGFCPVCTLPSSSYACGTNLLCGTKNAPCVWDVRSRNRAGVISYHPFFFPRYQPDNYLSVRKFQTSNTPFEYKRRWPSGFDRLSMGFIKRDKDETTDSNGDRLVEDIQDRTAHENTPKYSKRYFDRLSTGFIRKKRSAAPSVVNSLPNPPLNVQTNGHQTEPTEHPNSDVKGDSVRNMTVKIQGKDDEGSDYDKLGVDRLNAGFGNRPFDRLNSGFVKRPFVRLNSGFVKSPFDMLNYGFVKRPFDRLNSGFVKRPFDRLTSGFVKRPSDSKIDEADQMNVDEEKRGFDRLNYGFVKRPFDRINSGFVKKDVESFENVGNDDVVNEKRYFYRLNMGFIKRNDMVSGTDAASRVDDERGFDRLNSGFVKKSVMLEETGDFSGLDKRYFDRLTNVFFKKNDDASIESDEYETDVGKGRFHNYPVAS